MGKGTYSPFYNNSFCKVLKFNAESNSSRCVLQVESVHWMKPFTSVLMTVTSSSFSATTTPLKKSDFQSTMVISISLTLLDTEMITLNPFHVWRKEVWKRIITTAGPTLAQGNSKPRLWSCVVANDDCFLKTSIWSVKWHNEDVWEVVVRCRLVILCISGGKGNYICAFRATSTKFSKLKILVGCAEETCYTKIVGEEGRLSSILMKACLKMFAALVSLY